MKERGVKKKLATILPGADLDHILAEIFELPQQHVITPLISFLYQTDERLKWNAVIAIGQVLDVLAKSDMEAARIIMRRLLWNLNEESGGIGWGMTEAMGEILAVNEDLAKEYAHMLVSYMREENYLELPALQHGLLWGIGRLSMVRPDLLLKNNADGYMALYLESPDTVVQGLASRNFGILGIREAIPHIKRFVNMDQQVNLFQDRQMMRTTVGQLAREALDRLTV
jgi:hypothetical protein